MKWKNKKIFIDWVKKEKQEALEKCKKFFDNYNDDNFKYCNSIGSIACSNSNVNIEIFEKIVDDTIIEYFNRIMYIKTIDIYFLQTFLITVNNVNFYENSTLKTSSKNESYDEKIIKLKNRADDIQYYSQKQISIRIPVPTHVSTFERYEMNDEIIKKIQGYFGTERKQKNSPAYKNRQMEWNNKAKFSTDYLEMKDQMHHYKPKK